MDALDCKSAKKEATKGGYLEDTFLLLCPVILIMATLYSAISGQIKQLEIGCYDISDIVFDDRVTVISSSLDMIIVEGSVHDLRYKPSQQCEVKSQLETAVQRRLEKESVGKKVKSYSVDYFRTTVRIPSRKGRRARTVCGPVTVIRGTCILEP